MRPPFSERVRQITSAIPFGRVLTYGDVATLCGRPRAARAVGTALRSFKGEDIPWHRVINVRGQVSGKGEVLRAGIQRQRLEAEGHVFNGADSLNLAVARWDTDDAPTFFHEDPHAPPSDWEDDG